MSWSRIVKVHEGTLALGAGANNQTFLEIGDATTPYWRTRDERGLFTVEFDSNPNITTPNACFMEVKPYPGAAWHHVYTANGVRFELDLTTVIAPNWNITKTGVPLYPHMRWRFEGLTAGNAVNFRAWLNL